MARARVEATTTGHGLLALVGLAVVFLLLTPLFGVLKSGLAFSEDSLLYVALVFYGAATALYVGFGVTGTERYVKFASLATWAAFAANTLAVGHRWYLAGRPPFSNI